MPLDGAHVTELGRVAREIKRAVEAAATVAHPLNAALRGVDGVIFTGPPSASSADLRNVTIYADAAVDRSPSGTGTAAVMAVLDAMGLIVGDRPFVHEGVIGTRFTGRVLSRTMVGELPAIVPEIEGTAWITGEHTFVVDDQDPLARGFRL
jgi:proline racemase